MIYIWELTGVIHLYFESPKALEMASSPMTLNNRFCNQDDSRMETTIKSRTIFRYSILHFQSIPVDDDEMSDDERKGIRREIEK